MTDADKTTITEEFERIGTIGIGQYHHAGRSRAYYGLYICATHMDRAVIEPFASAFGGTVHRSLSGPSERYWWRLTGKRARDALGEMFPLLTVEAFRQKSIIAATFFDAGPMEKSLSRFDAVAYDFQRRCYERIRAINRGYKQTRSRSSVWERNET